MYAFSRNGKLVLISNFDSTERKHLEMRISSDGGKTWERIIPLEAPDAFFCYPHAVADDKNKVLYIVYENYKQHYLAVVSFDELGI